MADIQYYWEDLQPGQVRDLGTITPTKEEILAFASQFDPQAFHLDEEAAKLLQFQQAYQASAKILQVSQTMFDTMIRSLDF